jgi:hypothetical protein
VDLAGNQRVDPEQLVDGGVAGDADDHLTLTLAHFEGK